MEGLAQLETLCERLYNSQDPAERSHAERALQVFSSSAEYITQCQLILDTSSSPYAQHFASHSLVKQTTDQNLGVQLRLDILNYGVAFLASKGPKAQPFVVASLVQLVCRVSKLGWYDDDRFRGLVEEASKFLAQGTAEHYFLGLKIFNQLVLEMNQPNPGRSLTFHRKTACSFRDISLLQVFQTSLTSLGQLATADDKLKEQAISLALRCLSFDFVGASMDESSEDLTTIQIPSPWRPLLEDTSTILVFFEYYAANKPPISNQALECLVRMASVRRSLFTGEAERLNFLSHLMSGTREILRSKQGLSEHENYHEYCRLLGRLKTNYQLSELVSTEGYSEWVQLVADFTIKSLQSWQWASGSVYYLLGLWSRLVSSMPYLKADTPSLLENYVPQITKAYITSRLDSVQAVLQNNIEEDPLDNDEQLQEQLDSLPYLCRFQYEKTSEFIIQRLDPILRAYTEAGAAPSAAGLDEAAVQVMEGQLTWLVHIIGAIIRGRLSNSNAEQQEVVDGELSAKVFEPIQICDRGLHLQRYHQRSKQRLDLAFLAFFQNFRRVYVGDQAMHSSKALYTKLAELLGLQDHLMVLNVMVTKIATNLKCYTKSEDVIEQTLNLFQELAGGYMSGKLLLKLEAVNYILAHHTAEHFPFLNEFGSSRSRTVFYFTLGRLLFMEDSAPKFKAFMAPLRVVFKSLESTPEASFRTPAVKLALIGLMRDLRGITMATNSRRTFGLLFDWLYPSHMPLLGKAIEYYSDTPEVTTPLLKFFAEFVLNKTQRLTFDSSSPNGILLFKEVSKLIVAFGQRVLALPAPPASELYNCKYKGIWIALTILQRALAGNYVNFGVFELYGDRALVDALDTALNMSLSIPLPDIMAFRKLGRAYFALLEVLCHNHTTVIILLPTQTFSHIVASLDAGLKSLDVSISSQCASAVDNLAAYYFTHITAAVPSEDGPPPDAALKMAQHLRDCPTLFPEILKTLFEIVLFDDCSNQWSLSRPMLSLILINEQLFSDLKGQILASQASDQRQRLSECFDKLMTDVGRSLDSKNRDKFTQNLTMFRHDFRAK